MFPLLGYLKKNKTEIDREKTENFPKKKLKIRNFMKKTLNNVKNGFKPVRMLELLIRNIISKDVRILKK